MFQVIEKRMLVFIISLPIIWLGLDFIENASVYYLIEQYPAKIPLLCASLGYITTAKFSFLLLSIITLAVVLAIHKKHDPLVENHKD